MLSVAQIEFLLEVLRTPGITLPVAEPAKLRLAADTHDELARLLEAEKRAPTAAPG